MQSLFPVGSSTSSGAGDRNNNNGTNILSFKAGKIELDGPKANGCYKATADKRRGQLDLVKTNDNLLHFRWTDRSSGAIEDDRILFPGEITFKKVKTGKDSDRVYMIKYSSGTEPMMFWMQEKANDKDVDNCTKFNDYANNPEAVTAAANAASSTASGVRGADDDTASVGSAGDGDALSALLASLSAGGSSGSPTSGGGSLSAEALRALMSGGSANTAPPAAPVTTMEATHAAGEQAANGPQPVELQEVLTADGVLASGLLDDNTICQQLINQLPEGQQTRADLEAALRSPQLADSMRALSSALQSENYNAVMANFGLDPQAGMAALMRGDAVEAFISAVQNMADNTPATDENTRNGDNDMDAE